jgi:hypothetical protein
MGDLIMAEINNLSQPSQETSQMVDQAYDRGINHPYDQAYDNSASATTLPNSGGGISSGAVSDIVDQLMQDTLPENVRSNTVKDLNNQFAALSVDEKLAVFYYIYQGMGDSITPAALGAANVELTSSFFNEFNNLPKGDAQLDAQRALVRGDDTVLGRAYGSQIENNKLAIWYLIAQRMGKDVVGIPDDYQASDSANQALAAVKKLEFEQQITFLRDFANGMGKNSTDSAVTISYAQGA